MVHKLTTASGAVVLRIDEMFDEVLGLSVDDEQRQRGLVMVSERIGVFGF